MGILKKELTCKCGKVFKIFRRNNLIMFRDCKECRYEKQRIKNAKLALKNRTIKKKATKKKKKLSSYTTFERNADKLWREKIVKLWKNKCALCGQTGKGLNCHHHVGRRNKSTRWYVPNGILLCSGCHTFGIKSAHQDPEWFREKILVILGKKWLDDLKLQSNKIWNKDRDAVFDHLNFDNKTY